MLRFLGTLGVVASVLTAVIVVGRSRLPHRPDRPAPPVPSAVPETATVPGISPDIRVCLTPTPPRQVQLAVDGPFQICSIDQETVFGQYDRLPSVMVVPIEDGLQVGSLRIAADELTIAPEASPGVWIGQHQYRGRVRLLRRDEGVLAVNVLPLEEYVAGVVDGEMPASFPAAARRAQAVVARTYALSQMNSGRADFDVYATTRSQKYNGFQYRTPDGRRWAGESESARHAVADTAGLVCTHEGQLFCTYYSAVCGGRTTHGRNVFSDAAAPLVSVPCEWCREASRFRWTRRLSAADVARQLKPKLSASRTRTVRIFQRAVENSMGPAAEFVVGDGHRSVRISAAELRRRLSLDSVEFDVTESAGRGGEIVFTIHGRGHGHGVGMCQWGARGQALAGRDFRAILQHYYPGSRLVRSR